MTTTRKISCLYLYALLWLAFGILFLFPAWNALSALIPSGWLKWLLDLCFYGLLVYGELAFIFTRFLYPGQIRFMDLLHLSLQRGFQKMSVLRLLIIPLYCGLLIPAARLFYSPFFEQQTYFPQSLMLFLQDHSWGWTAYWTAEAGLSILAYFLLKVPLNLMACEMPVIQAVKDSFQTMKKTRGLALFALADFFLNVLLKNTGIYPAMYTTDFNLYFLDLLRTSSLIQGSFFSFLALAVLHMSIEFLFIRYLVKTWGQRIPLEKPEKDRQLRLEPVLLSAMALGLAVQLVWGGWSCETPAARFLIAGHRGSTPALENTLESIHLAAQEGADYVEVDPQLSRDGVLVLFHDDDLMRLAGRPDKIADLTLAQLKQVVLKKDGQTGQIPTLEEAIIQAQEDGVCLMMDLKSSDQQAQQICSEIIALNEKYDFAGQALIQAANKKTADLIKEAHPEWTVGYVEDGSFCRTRLSGSPDYINVRSTQISVSLLDQCRRQGVTCWIWSEDDPDILQDMAYLGIQGAVGNNVARMEEMKQ